MIDWNGPRKAGLVLSLAVLAACSGGRDEMAAGAVNASTRAATAETQVRSAGVDDVVVIAVIDSGINPYHFDYLASQMPQHQNTDAADDLPLDQDPATWLAGHPGAAAFASYQPLNLTLSDDPNFRSTDLHALDQAEWNKVQLSSGTENADVHMVWMPGTKIIGHVAFPGALIGDPVTSALIGQSEGPIDTWASESHGIGSSSVSVGNIHGSCPQCLLVYVHGTSEEANEWVAKQDWIDAQTNSWGASTVFRERYYNGSNVELQREAVDRGQQIFFSAGNGQGNAFVVPNTTLLSSQEGPDWIVTVGAIDPEDGSSFSGHGKPADLASVGRSYPSATGGGDGVTASGNFSGTSNATPVVAGVYGKALYQLRQALPGASRLQDSGIVAFGPAGCGAANADCALADGEVTIHELRQALFRAARYSDEIWNVGGQVTLPAGSPVDQELEFLAEGHGSFFGRLRGDDDLSADVTRILDFVRGEWFEEESAEAVAWFTADSICRQAIWGAWDHGYAARFPAPAPDPSWPVRSFLAEACPTVLPPLVDVIEPISTLEF